METFLEQNNKLTLKNEKEALFFSDNAFSKEEDYIYVLDTNALLKIFELDLESTKILENEFKSNRYFGTRQIEIEFLRNKDYVSQYYMIDQAHKMIDEFNSNIVTRYEEFIRTYSYIFSTDEIITKKIKRFSTSLKNLSKDIEKNQNNYKENTGKEIIKSDLDIISTNIDFTTSLEPDFYLKLESEYRKQVEHHKLLLSEKREFDKEYRNYVFPGMGEKKKSNPEGDYYIFHEMMKLAIEKNKNIIFLTNDLEKSDWIDSKAKREYNHYKSIFYNISKHAIKIISFTQYLDSKGIKSERLLETTIDDFYEDEFVSIFLTKYAILERTIRIWARSKDLDFAPITQLLIRRARESDYISEETFNSYTKIRILRNEIIHGLPIKLKNLTEDEKNDVLFQLDKLIDYFR